MKLLPALLITPLVWMTIAIFIEVLMKDHYKWSKEKIYKYYDGFSITAIIITMFLRGILLAIGVIQLW